MSGLPLKYDGFLRVYFIYFHCAKIVNRGNHIFLLKTVMTSCGGLNQGFSRNTSLCYEHHILLTTSDSPFDIFNLFMLSTFLHICFVTVLPVIMNLNQLC